MDQLVKDLDFALRSFRKRPGFTAAAVLTLALGIGATTAIFSVVDNVLLRPLPYENPTDIVVVWEARSAGFSKMVVSPPNFHDFREQNDVFEHQAAYDPTDLNRFADGVAEQLRGARVSGELLSLLGVTPQLGRFVTSEDDRPGASPVIVLSHGLWQRRFGGATDIVGRSLIVNGQPHTVIGVMPAGFNFPPPIALEGMVPSVDTDAWVPFRLDYAAGQRGAHFLMSVARLRSGVTLDRAEASLATVAARLEEQYPATNQGWTVRLVPLAEEVTGALRPALFAILAAVGFVLLIACVNVANLLLARGVSRRREIATRVALGAGPSRLVRQTMTESILLALVGGAGGVLLAAWGVDLLISLAPTLPRFAEVSINGHVVLATVLITILTGLLFGMAPALLTRSSRLHEFLKEGGRGAGAGPTLRRLQNALVVAEVAISLVLLVGAGLFLNSFLRLRSVDPGFRTENVLTMRVSLPSSRYASNTERAAFFQEALPELQALPGVQSAGFSTDIPLADDRQGTGIVIVGEPLPESDQAPNVNFSFVSPEYFQTVGIRPVRGRMFTEQDRTDTAPVVIVNETIARRHFPNQDPVGRRVVVGFNQTEREIIGVVADERHLSLGEAPVPNVYLPYFQVPWSGRPVRFVFRTEVSPTALAASAREVIRAVDESVPIYDIRSMEQVVAESVAQPRLATVLLAIFASLALALAAVGIYGVVSYAASQRTHEVGMRMALGARRGDIIRLVVSDGMMLTGAGVAIGLAASLGLTRLVAGLLFGVSPTDPATFLVITAVLAAAAFVASCVPALRSSRVDPVIALRNE